LSWEENFSDSLIYLESQRIDQLSKGHTWKRDDVVYPDGYVPADLFALSEGFHNGPECDSCGYSFCHHCTPLSEIPDCTRPVPELRGELSRIVRLKRGAE
jgi:hypothetical protein